jgi:HAD superfamily hydrolase (TIGR01509 family)
VGRLADLDAVTFDANGTLVRLVDPVPALEKVLGKHGIERPASAIRRAFEAEGRVYAARAVEAHRPDAFATLQRECTGVFLEELGADELDPAEFAPLYVEAMQFELLPGVRESLEMLRRRGLELAIVANFDLSLAARLEELRLGQAFSVVVTPADAGVAKPSARIFELALERLGVAPERALHIGDGAADEEGAAAAGMNFAWAPIPQALESWA